MTPDDAASVSFDRAAPFYDETRGFPPGVEPAVAACICAAGALTAASRVIEIGIGTGRIALPLAQHIGAVCGVDIARAMMDRLRAKRTTEPIHFAQADASRLPFPARAFDAAVSIHVFHLIPTWRETLRELARVLRPGAPLLLGWSRVENPLGLDEVFEKRRDQPNVGVPHEKRGLFLVEEGWRPVGDASACEFTTYRAPQIIVDSLRRRVASSTWRMTDEALAEEIAFAEAAIAARTDDPTRPVLVRGRFQVQAYLPPA